jgi:hypothetical protein
MAYVCILQQRFPGTVSGDPAFISVPVQQEMEKRSPVSDCRSPIHTIRWNSSSIAGGDSFAPCTTPALGFPHLFLFHSNQFTVKLTVVLPDGTVASELLMV